MIFEALQNVAAAIRARNEEIMRPLTDGLMGDLGDHPGG